MSTHVDGSRSKAPSGNDKPKTTATIWIVESLNFSDEDNHREGEIISRTLRLSGKRTNYTYVRTPDELDAFIKEFGKSEHRYLHVSCHGNSTGFWTTTKKIPTAEFAKMIAPHVSDRRVFLSTCLAGNSQFANELLLKSECRSVLAPVGKINFDDAAIFWTAFYHLMFKSSPTSMKHRVIEKHVVQCALLVGKPFRLFRRKGAKVVERTFPDDTES
jgi:hypothetical protein